MPSNGKFGFSVLVGGKVLSEYAHPEDDSRTLVESILWAPNTYYVEIKEFCKFSDEIETQEWPVTPYEIKVYTKPGCRRSYYKVYVDGVRVAEMYLDSGESKIIQGFPGEDSSYSEFLFSLPRFAESETDRVDKKRSLRVGKIEVICHDYYFSHNEMRPSGAKSSSRKEIDYTQANKKDVVEVTKNRYCMTTTRKGRMLRDGKPYDPPRDTKKEKKDHVGPQKMVQRRICKIGDELGKLRLEYHMTQTLLDWGIRPTRPDWHSDTSGKENAPARPCKKEPSASK